MPTRISPKILFVNTRDRVGADVDVHLTLLRHASRSGIDARMVANRHSKDRATLEDKLADLPIDRLDWAGLGIPGRGIAGAGWSMLAGGEWFANLVRFAAQARGPNHGVHFRFGRIRFHAP